MTVFVGSLLWGIIGGSLGGLVGMALGLGSSVFGLSHANFRDGLIGGAFLGALPALLIAGLSAAAYRRRPQPSTRVLALLHSAALTFLLVSILATIWVGHIASC